MMQDNEDLECRGMRANDITAVERKSFCARYSLFPFAGIAPGSILGGPFRFLSRGEIAVYCQELAVERMQLNELKRCRKKKHR